MQSTACPACRCRRPGVGPLLRLTDGVDGDFLLPGAAGGVVHPVPARGREWQRAAADVGESGAALSL